MSNSGELHNELPFFLPVMHRDLHTESETRGKGHLHRRVNWFKFKNDIFQCSRSHELLNDYVILHMNISRFFNRIVIGFRNGIFIISMKMVIQLNAFEDVCATLPLRRSVRVLVSWCLLSLLRVLWDVMLREGWDEWRNKWHSKLIAKRYRGLMFAFAMWLHSRMQFNPKTETKLLLFGSSLL